MNYYDDTEEELQSPAIIRKYGARAAAGVSSPPQKKARKSKMQIYQSRGGTTKKGQKSFFKLGTLHRFLKAFAAKGLFEHDTGMRWSRKALRAVSDSLEKKLRDVINKARAVASEKKTLKADAVSKAVIVSGLSQQIIGAEGADGYWRLESADGSLEEIARTLISQSRLKELCKIAGSDMGIEKGFERASDKARMMFANIAYCHLADVVQKADLLLSRFNRQTVSLKMLQMIEPGVAFLGY